ncbi:MULTISPECIES: PTS sugar transporter subunit IIB [unclassified Sporolactobacillus]|uniref:PTS sugar transporter subunit IIB n=1 Tax=unclassified Sporolactobacillus TaxID=2628533 RepID=UPI002367EB40|nr:PTS sugar transporter subunit IIB [Sporolactobacillus sp. CQH2019]MDD9149954.1 PTS sugar transporter subunit IIB [Sporolactobacillus sp. CQH2019]
MKIAAICQSGLGSSFMVQMNIENVLKEENVDTGDIEVVHFDTGGLNEQAADYFFLGSDLEDRASGLPKDRVYLLKSLIDKEELRGKVNEILDKENIPHS